jgi:hypothetical protein
LEVGVQGRNEESSEKWGRLEEVGQHGEEGGGRGGVDEQVDTRGRQGCHRGREEEECWLADIEMAFSANSSIALT